MSQLKIPTSSSDNTLNVPPENRPRHIAVIMDGNGRWALKRNQPRIAGHRAGAKAVRDIIIECARLKIQALTLYSFSMENWKRPADEVGALMNLYLEYLVKERQELVERKVYYMSHQRPKPGHYTAVGWVKAHPKTQETTLLIESLAPQESDWESFELDEAKPLLEAWKVIGLKSAIADLRDHVTRIWHRDEILLVTLLAYCAPRWLVFDNQIIRGWLNVAIVGDPGSGKSQTCQKVADHCGVGDFFCSGQ